MSNETQITTRDLPTVEFLLPPDAPNLEDIAEAYKWHELFQQGYITTHELSKLNYFEKPEVEGELFKVETRNLHALASMFRNSTSDEEFRDKLDEIRILLPGTFMELQGLEQTQPHQDIDPLEHTFNALNNLDTSRLSQKEAMVARTAIIFHDFGKMVDPYDREHPRRSAEMVVDYLERMGFSEEEEDVILNQIKWHDALGDVSRQDGRNIFNPEDVLVFFPDERALLVHKEIAVADISSIPGLARFLPQVERTYQELLSKLRRESKKTSVDTVNTVPFEELKHDDFYKIYDRLFKRKDFDETDIALDMQERKEAYLSLPPQEQEVVEKFAVQCALKNWPGLLDTLKIIGRETDEEIIDDLEQKYGRELHNLRIAVHLFKMTYGMWRMNYDLRTSNEFELSPDEINTRLIEIKTAAQELSKYKVWATHATTSEGEYNIGKSGALVKSKADWTGGSHFEGEGVYVGILGSYRDWNEDRVYDMRVSLADTLPILVSFDEPKGMACVLCDMLDISGGLEGLAIPFGLVEFKQIDYSKYPITEWKVQLLEELLGGKAKIGKDENDRPCVICDTKEEPIVWASIARALMVERFIPMSSLRYTEFYRANKIYDTLNTEDDNRPYEWTDDYLGKVRRIKGLKHGEKIEDFL